MLTRTQYERLIYTLPSRYSSIRLSTLVLAPPGLDVARLTGLVALGDDCVLCVYELLNFGQGIIEAYRYEVSRCRPPFTESPLPEAAEYCRASYPDKEQSFTICLDETIGLENLRALNLAKDDLFICRDVALDDEATANLALQCRLKTI